MDATKKTKKSKDKEQLPTPYSQRDVISLMEAGKDFIIDLRDWEIEGQKGLKYLARAIHRSLTLEKISLANIRKISPRDMERIIEVLSDHKTITTLKIRMSSSDAEYKILTSVLQKNARVRYLELDCAELSLETATLLSDSLKVNTSLDEIKFIATKLDVPKLAILAEGLKVHPKIHTTQYYSETLNNECSKIIFSIIEQNPRIKSLELSASLREFTALEEFVKTNTTLEAIGFYEIRPPHLDPFLQALAVNNGLKEFTMRHSHWDYSTCKILANTLKTNTTLQILRGDSKYLNAEHVRLLSKGLAANNTLKKLDFRENNLNSVMDKTKNPKGKPTGTGAFCEALKNNTSITDIDISNNKLYERGYVDIAALLKNNKGIRKLQMDLFIGHTTIDESLRLICESLKVNKTLTSLKLYQCVKFSNQAWSYITEMLEVNRALSTLEIPYVDIPENVQRKLKKNKRRREKGVRSAKMLISMIALRPKAYSAVLPIEIWALVLRYYEVTGVNINFEKEFLAKLKN